MKLTETKIAALWLLDHPGKILDDFEYARAPFKTGEHEGKHHHTHQEFLLWLKWRNTRRPRCPLPNQSSSLWDLAP